MLHYKVFSEQPSSLCHFVKNHSFGGSFYLLSSFGTIEIFAQIFIHFIAADKNSLPAPAHTYFLMKIAFFCFHMTPGDGTS